MTLRLHHMGILVKDIARGVDDYVKRFGYEVKSDVIHDPVQTAFVQFVKLAGESAYIEFVTPDGPNSKLSNALQKGGGINHLCYLTEDIQKTCEDLTDKGNVLTASSRRRRCISRETHSLAHRARWHTC